MSNPRTTRHESLLSGGTTRSSRTRSTIFSPELRRAKQEREYVRRQNEVAPLIFSPPKLFNRSHAEICFTGVDIIGMIKRTPSGKAGAAFTIGNEHEQKMAFDYVESIRKSRKSAHPVIFVPVNSDFENPSTIPVRTILLTPSPIDVEEFSVQTNHPTSVLSACEVANIILSKPSNDRNGKMTDPMELFDLPIDDPIVELAAVSAEWNKHKEESTYERNYEIFKISENADRVRFENLRRTNQEVKIKCLVYKSNKSLEEYIEILQMISNKFMGPYNDRIFDHEGLTYSRIVSENACRWNWRNTDVFVDSLLGDGASRDFGDKPAHLKPKNYIYIVGATGEGKSSTFNSILELKKKKRETDEFGNTMADVGAKGSTTVNAQEGRMVFKNEKEEFVLIDTPGFLDDKGRDRIFFDNLSDIIAGRPTANLVLLVKKKEARVDIAEVRILEQYRKIFGPNFDEMLRVVCTSQSVLMYRDEDDEEANLQPTIDTFNGMLVEKGIFSEKQVAGKVFFIGRLEEQLLANYVTKSGRTPKAELERLRNDIRISTPVRTENTRSLEELLRDESSVWRNKRLMITISEQAFSCIGESHFSAQKDAEASSTGAAVFVKEWTGPIGRANHVLRVLFRKKKSFGLFDTRHRVLTFHADDPDIQNFLSNSPTPQELYANSFSRFNSDAKYLVAVVRDNQYTQDRTLISETVFDIIKPGQTLTRSQRKRIAASVLGIDASNPETKYSMHLCGSECNRKPNSLE